MKNIIKYTIGLPIILVFVAVFLFLEFMHLFIAYFIVVPCRFVLIGKFEKEELLFWDVVTLICKPIDGNNKNV